ncbi:hypothetical protein FRB90_004896 [Tulasnella sp. 427]|nr:hypothetical protein FRB90_004896 [Tulasnella sp. 427]
MGLRGSVIKFRFRRRSPKVSLFLLDSSPGIADLSATPSSRTRREEDEDKHIEDDQFIDPNDVAEEVPIEDDVPMDDEEDEH